MKNINDYRKESTINKKFRYEEGIMSRREWLNMWRIKGATVKEVTRRNYAAEEKLEKWLYDNRGDISGNMNWPPTKHYFEKKTELAAGIFKTEYRLYFPNSNTLQDITKTEYDYFKNMELAEDKATEANDLTNRIEAGIATDQEIEEAESKDLEFFRKYAS